MTTTLPWRQPLLPLRLHRRPIPLCNAVTVRAFQRSDFDRFARNAWRTANDGFEQFIFEAKKTAERIDRRYSVSRRLNSVAQSAADRFREVDREMEISVRWRTFSMDFVRNWPRYRRQLNDFLDTPLGRSFAGACPACKRQFVGYKNQIIRCGSCGNIVWQPEGDFFSRGGRGRGSSSSKSDRDIIDVEFEEK
ncbi:uncharacterized protein LOC110623381 isoform X2 [Manihot esculenta]|uniref:uncharacterized protein LOC110623381 isoform X2 n=1 Tax=Manihot esculenta TaxID=3983 RepID=UPI001CC62C27|nr:uncharacterized protein LOC110623381 isoform X2 [Manihot esculenta]